MYFSSLWMDQFVNWSEPRDVSHMSELCYQLVDYCICHFSVLNFDFKHGPLALISGQWVRGWQAPTCPKSSM